MIATTWTEEPKPPGNYYPTQAPTTADSSLESAVTEDMLTRLELTIRELEPHDPMHRRLLTTYIAQFERLMQTRWRLIEEAGGAIYTAFLIVLVFWLAVVFASFGLNAPRNVFTVSSQPLRHALTYLSH